MLLNSVPFFFFAAIVVPLYWLASLHRGALQNLVLLVVSYVFYAWWDPRFLALLMASTGIAYFTALKMEAAGSEKTRSLYMAVAAVWALGVLGLFKYFNFFAGSIVAGLDALGMQASWTGLHLVLPLGISFYTFQTLGYSIDVYRGHVKASRDPLQLAIFVSFFPLILAGPIERAKNLLPQIAGRRTLTLDRATTALSLILLGLFTKSVVADGLSFSIDPVFTSTGGYSRLDVVVASYGYVLQMFADFAGYTAIARGVAGLLGFDIIENFKNPFYARSPSDYWTRWHISLSSWVKDYIYLPMALVYMRKEKGFANEQKPHVYSMVLMGLWHGAAWTYILWGLYHGVMLVLWDVLKLPRKWRKKLPKVPAVVPIAFYFHITLVSLLIFRAPSLGQLGRLVGTVFAGGGDASLHIAKPSLPTLLGIPLLLVMDFLSYRAGTEHFHARWHPAARGALYAICAILILMGFSNAAAEFIYLKF